VILVRIKLQAEAMSAEIDARQHLGDAFGCRLVGRHLRLQSDLEQRPPGLGSAGKFSHPPERGDEVLVGADPPRDLDQPPQAFAGHQHQVVAGLVDGAPDPGLDRRRIRRIMDGEHRALQHIGTLFRQQAGELGFLAGLQNQKCDSR